MKEDGKLNNDQKVHIFTMLLNQCDTVAEAKESFLSVIKLIEGDDGK